MLIEKKNLHISGPTVQICVVQGPTVLWKHMCRVWDKPELSLWVSIHKPVIQNKLWGTLWGEHFSTFRILSRPCIGHTNIENTRFNSPHWKWRMSLLPLFFSPILDSVILSAFSSLFNGHKTFRKLDRLFVTLISQKHLCQEPGHHLFEMQTLGELPVSSCYGRAGTGLWWALSSKLS